MPNELDDLVKSAREVDRPSSEHADALFEKISASLGPAGIAAGGASAAGGSAGGASSGASAAGGMAAGQGAVVSTTVALGSVSARLIWLGTGAAVVAGATWAIVPSGSTNQDESASPSLVESAPVDEAKDDVPPDENAHQEPQEVPGESEKVQGEPSSSQASPTKKVALRDNLAGEVAVLRAAKLEMNAKRYEAALGRLDEYERRFPRGELRAEARATRVLVLCGLQRTEAARIAAKGLAEDSALGKRLGSGCPER